MDGTVNTLGILSHAEIAAIMIPPGILTTTRSAWHAEHRAVLKLLADPNMRAIAVETDVVPDDDSSTPSPSAVCARCPRQQVSYRSA